MTSKDTSDVTMLYRRLFIKLNDSHHSIQKARAYLNGRDSGEDALNAFMEYRRIIIIMAWSYGYI